MKTTREMKLNNWSSKKVYIHLVQEMFIKCNVYFSFNYFNFIFGFQKNNWFKIILDIWSLKSNKRRCETSE